MIPATPIIKTTGTNGRDHLAVVAAALFLSVRHDGRNRSGRLGGLADLGLRPDPRGRLRGVSRVSGVERLCIALGSGALVCQRRPPRTSGPRRGGSAVGGPIARISQGRR